MSVLSQNMNRAAWYYRVLREGYAQVGDEIVLLETKNPKWTIANIQRYLYMNLKNEEAMKEIVWLTELGSKSRQIFKNRLRKKALTAESLHSEAVGEWSQYHLVERRKETPRIVSFVFEALEQNKDPTKAEPGSHIHIKLGEDEKVVRAYSVVEGDSNRFILGIALDKSTTRGGFQFLHENVKIGDTLAFSKMKSDFLSMQMQTNTSSSQAESA
jgi:hypothetical protein